MAEVHTPQLVLKTGHIGLNVTDLGRSREFYCSVFGLEWAGGSLEGPQRYGRLKDGKRLVLTLWEQSKGPLDRRMPGMHHLSFEAASVEEVKGFEARAKQAGARMIHDGLVRHSESAASGGIFFEDPDGIRLEVYTPDGLADCPAPSGAAPTCGFF